MSCAALYSAACLPAVEPGQQQQADCHPDLPSLEDRSEAQMAELLVLLQQQQPITTDPADDLQLVMDGVDGELLSAEQAIDAEISQLLALKQARLQQRRQSHLKLLQQLVAGRAMAAVPASAGLLAHCSTPLQPRDVAIQLEQLQHQLPSVLSLASPDVSWSAQSRPAVACHSRTSIDLGCLQRGMGTGMSAGMASNAFDSIQADALPGQMCSLAMQSPVSTPAGSFADPIHQSIFAGSGLAVDVDLDVSLAAVLSSLSTQDSSTVLLSPQSNGPAALPSPAMRRINSAGVLSAMERACLQDHAGQLSAQQCGVSTMAGPACMVPVSEGYMPSPAQAMHAGQVMNTVGAGSYWVAPAHSASFSGASVHAGAPMPKQAKNRRHSIHVYPSAYTCAGMQLRADAGNILALHNGFESAACAPAAARSMRSGDPRLRRMSADVYSRSARPLVAPNGLAAPMQPYPVYTDGSMYRDCRVDGMGCAAVSVGPQATLCPAAGSACASTVGLAAKQPAPAGAREPECRRSFDARRGGTRRKSVEMPSGCAAPSWAGPTWDPKRDVQSAASLPAKKGAGTGVFMPRTAA